MSLLVEVTRFIWAANPSYDVYQEFYKRHFWIPAFRGSSTPYTIFKMLPEAPAFSGDMKAASVSGRVQRVRYSYSPSISLPV